MDCSVTSDYLKELLDQKDVKAAVFTTYNFEPEFFELEIIPLLLKENVPLSSDDRVKQFQVREALRESLVDIEVFYDLKQFREDGRCSPSMEYAFHGVHRGNNAFHAKLILILAYDSRVGKECLLVGAGSNNLTRAGWWDNIECVHWETVCSGDVSLTFLNRLKHDVAWLLNERRLGSTQSISALDQVDEFLQGCKSSRQAKDVFYYGINDIDRGFNFQRFLKQHKGQYWHYNNWTLEIISPFFAEDAQSTNHEQFFDLGVKEIHVFLPVNQEGAALCQPEYFNYINEKDCVKWAAWDEDTWAALAKQGTYRRLHAKIYHFYNKVQSWAFVGSVNFTRKAMLENAEAGFLVKLDAAGPLLKPIADTEEIDRFENPVEPPPGYEVELASAELPKIYLAYDWKEQRLTGVTGGDERYVIDILTPEGHSVIASWSLTEELCRYEGDTTAMESLLRNGSLVKVSGRDALTGNDFPPHLVMLMQTGWSHKPLDLPHFTPQQILSIYADMTPDKRQLLLMNAQIRKLVLDGVAGDMTVLSDDFKVEQFFSEYAEIFHAFRRLRKRLSEAFSTDNSALVDYYLSGKGMDSLPTLLDKVTGEDAAVNPVTTYLLLLCAKEIYQDPEFSACHQVDKWLQELGEKIGALKSSGAIRLEDIDPAARPTFFQWFEEQFFKRYRLRGTHA